MKLNWGHKLVIFTVLFMLFIIAMVTFMMKQNVELVESDYYEKGIRYQEVIDEQSDADQYVSITLQTKPEQAVMVASRDSANTSTNGELSFYRPSDQKKDFKIPVTFSFSQPFVFPLTAIEKGIWKLTLDWTDAKGRHQVVKNFTF